MTTHQLAQELMALPDVPLAEAGIIQTEPHVHEWRFNPEFGCNQCWKCFELDCTVTDGGKVSLPKINPNTCEESSLLAFGNAILQSDAALWKPLPSKPNSTTDP